MYKFEKKIREILIKQNIVIAFRYLLIILLLILLTFNLFFALYSPAPSSQFMLFLVAISLKIFLALSVLYLVLQANKSFLSRFEAAKFLDRFNKDKFDTYQNAFELKKELKESEILNRILKKTDSKAKNQAIKTELSNIKPLLIITIILMLFSGLLFIFHLDHFEQSYSFFKLNEMPQPQHKKVVEVIPKNLSLLRNSRLEIKVIDPEPEIEHRFFYKLEKNWREEKLNNYKIVFDNLDFSFSYFVRTPFAISDTFQIQVFELPIVKNIHLCYDFPEYSGIKQQIEKTANGNIKALSGTKITLEIRANNALESAKMFFSNGEIKSLKRLGKASFKTDFEINSSLSYHFKLVDVLGNQSRKIEKSITAISDRKPEIKIVQPGKDTLLTQNMLLPLKIFASDDFGLENMELKFSINYEEEQQQSIQKKIYSNTITKDFVFDLTNLVLIPGDKITYWTQITDNSPQKQTTISQKYTARFPSIEEIYQEIEEEERKKTKILDNTLEKSEELQKEFEEKRRELMKKEEYDWEDKKQLEKLLEKQENLSKDVEKVVQDFKDLFKKFEDNKALSSETLEKMKKIQELMEEISNEELQKAMEEMRKKMENLDPEVMQKAMKNFKFSMEDFSEKLEQTIKLLEDIKKEQAVQKALEIAEEMEKMQTELNKRTAEEKLSKEQLSKQQKEISEKLENLEEQLEKIDELLDDQKDSDLSENLQKLQEQMKSDDLASDLENSEKNLSEGAMEEAAKSQQKAMPKMQSIKQKLEEMQQSMSSGMMNNAGEIIQKTIRRLLIYSQFQEDASSKFTENPYVILKDEIAIFEGIDLILKELFATPMIVLVLGPKFMYDTNFTSSIFREMFQYINDAKTHKVDNFLEDITKGLNLMIFDLMQAKDNLQQDGSGGGMQNMMQMLQQMGQQQMMMNMMTQQLMQQMMQNGKMSSQDRRQAQELAANQQQIAENLKRMLQTNSEAQKQSASINRMIEDIESIVKDLKMGRLNNELIQKQERILSRLLDAQKSIHKREFSQKRKAENSEIEDWDIPEEIKLKFDKMRQKALLDEEYKKYPQEYQELIREYLKMLNEKRIEE